MLQAIIFDVDGTLAETDELHRLAYNAAFKEFGLPWHWSQPLYGQLLAKPSGKERLAHFIDMLGGLGRSPTEVNRLISQLHNAKMAIYVKMLKSGDFTVRPGVAELIEAAQRENIRLAIATTMSRPVVEALLSSGLNGRDRSAFELVAAGDAVQEKQPSADLFRTTLERLGLPARACLAIEDSASGLRAALKAGLTTLVTPSCYTSSDDFSGAVRVTGTLADLVAAPPDNDERRLPDPAVLLAAIRKLHLDGLALWDRAGLKETAA